MSRSKTAPVTDHGNRMNATRRSELDSEPIQPNGGTISDGFMGSKSSLERRRKYFHGRKVGFEQCFRGKTVDAIAVEEDRRT